MARVPRLDGRPLSPQDLERICREVRGFDRIEAVSEDMRHLIEEAFPGLKSKLSPGERKSRRR